MGELIQGMRPCVASISKYDLNFFCLVRYTIFISVEWKSLEVLLIPWISLCNVLYCVPVSFNGTGFNFSKEIQKLGSPIGAIDVVVLCRVTLSFTEATHSLC